MKYEKLVKELYPHASCCELTANRFSDNHYVVVFGPGKAAKTSKEAWKSAWEQIQEIMLQRLVQL